MTKSEDIKELAAAMVKFQGEIGNVAKDGINPFFKSKYATLENIISTVKPILAKHGLSYAQFPSFEGLTTILMHASGEFIAEDTKITIKDHTPQGQGSAITYMRRYALSSILGIATEDDDDGNAASRPNPTKEKYSLAAEQKKTIQKLCDDKALVPLLSKADYERYIKENTGLTFGQDSNEEIIIRLKAVN